MAEPTAASDPLGTIAIIISMIGTILVLLATLPLAIVRFPHLTVIVLTRNLHGACDKFMWYISIPACNTFQGARLRHWPEAKINESQKVYILIQSDFHVSFNVL